MGTEVLTYLSRYKFLKFPQLHCHLGPLQQMMIIFCHPYWITGTLWRIATNWHDGHCLIGWWLL